MRRSRGFKSSKRRMMLRQIQTVVIIIRGESRVQILKKVMILCYLQTSFCSWKFSTAALTCFFSNFQASSSRAKPTLWPPAWKFFPSINVDKDRVTPKNEKKKFFKFYDPEIRLVFTSILVLWIEHYRHNQEKTSQ